jgi:Helix-turn-helix domain
MTDEPRRLLRGSERARVAKELRARYDAGEDVREIARSLGRSYCFAYDLIRETGALREWGGRYDRRQLALSRPQK